MHMRPLCLSAALLLTPAAIAQQGQPKPVDAVHPESTGAVPQATLDDFIAGFNGDRAAMDRAMKDTADILTKDPNNVEALAWNSSGKGALCGEAFSKGDFKNGMQLWTESKTGLSRSVELAPGNTTVRIVRGKSMLEASLHDPNPATSNDAANTAVTDLEAAIELMGKDFDKAPQSFRQEIYAWLYQAASKAGDKERADKYKKLAGDKAGDALDRLNQSAENTVLESAKAALVILDSPLVQQIKPDLLAGLRSPAKLDAVIAILNKNIDANPDDAASIAWRGFTRILRTSSMFAQGRIDEGVKAWEKGLNEINAAASTDATTRDAVLLRALSNLELARHASEPEKRAEARQKTTTDLARFERMLKDGNITLNPEATAAFQLTNARIHLMNGDTKKARAAVTAATATDKSAETAKRAKVWLEVADLIDKRQG
jgi:tetratricopeptide (TPR) repeat protein